LSEQETPAELTEIPSMEKTGETQAERHAHYITFQMAEVLVSKSLFREILERIRRLKPVPIGSG